MGVGARDERIWIRADALFDELERKSTSAHCCCFFPQSYNNKAVDRMKGFYCEVQEQTTGMDDLPVQLIVQY